MQRVVYETRQQCDSGVEVICVTEKIADCDLDLIRSTVRGQPVKIIQSTALKIALPKSTPAIRPSRKADYQALRQHFLKHYRRSLWKDVVMMLVDEFIKDLEWEVILAGSGFKSKPPVYHWERFKKQYLKTMPNCRYTWSTRNMLPRLEEQPWLQAYLKEDKN